MNKNTSNSNNNNNNNNNYDTDFIEHTNYENGSSKTNE